MSKRLAEAEARAERIAVAGYEAEKRLAEAEAALATARRGLEADDAAITALMTDQAEQAELLSRSENLRRDWLRGTAGKHLLDEFAKLESRLANALADVNQVGARRDQALSELAAALSRQRRVAGELRVVADTGPLDFVVRGDLRALAAELEGGVDG